MSQIRDPEPTAITVRLDRAHLLQMVENSEWALRHAYLHDGGDPPEESALWPTLQHLRGWLEGKSTIDRVAAELLIEWLHEREATTIEALGAHALMAAAAAQRLGLDADVDPQKGRIELWAARGAERQDHVGVLLLLNGPHARWRLFLPTE